MSPPPQPKSLEQSPIVINAPIFILGNGMNASSLAEIQNALHGVLAGLQPQLRAPAAASVPVAPSPPAVPMLACAAAQDISYRDYCLDDTLDVERPFGRTSIEVSTFDHERRLLEQLQRVGLPLDPPDWNAFQSWVNDHPKGKAGLDNHRRAYARYCGYHGITVPSYANRRWDNRKAVERGRRAGTLKQRERFFRNGPWDVVRLLGARPYRDEALNDAFRHIVALMATTGPRSSEPRFLRLEDVDQDRRAFKNWWQEKKDVTRTISVPEAWLWDGPGPTVKWYLTRVRPKLADAGAGADKQYLLSSDGRAYASDGAWAKFVRSGVVKTLGYPIGPHAFRRFCATIRYTLGWSVEEVADFLDDTTQAVRNSYLDDAFVARVGRRNLNRKGDERPALPPLWNLPKALDLEPAGGPHFVSKETKTGTSSSQN